METPILQNNILDFKPKAELLVPGEETVPLAQGRRIAVVTQVKGRIPLSVALNGNNYPVTDYLCTMPGIAPSVSIGDKVLISMQEEGVLILGVVTPIDAPVMASFGYVEGKLLIEAQGAVILKSGKATVELTETGEIRIDGEDVRTVAEETLTLLGGNVELN